MRHIQVLVATLCTSLVSLASTNVALAQEDIDLDASAAAPAEEGAEDAAAPEAEPAAEPTGELEGLGDICKIDPTACPAVDLDKAAARDLDAQIYAVQQIYALKRNRVELTPYWSFTMNDQFVSHTGPGVAVNYYLTNVMAVGVNGNLYAGFNSTSDFNFQTSRAARVGLPITEYAWNANLNFAYVPAYGKLAGFGDFIFHYDVYALGGVGLISTRPIAVVDPDNRTFDFKAKLAFNAGLGLRVFINRWLAVNAEIRDYIFDDDLENPTIDANAQDPDTWLDDGSHFTNNVQAQIGISVFLPFSWEYRQPK